MSETIYRAAKYIRLSYADSKTGESDSVENQRKLLDNFIASQPDIEAVMEKVDDGVSGIIFDRKEFKEMMAEIHAGNIDCVVVKDLSRFGREYIETGRYTFAIFFPPTVCASLPSMIISIPCGTKPMALWSA